MRLIDATPLIDECEEIISIEWNHKVSPSSWACAEEEFKQRLLDAPTIEAEPVRHGRWANGVCLACGFDLRCLTDGENDLEQWVWDEAFPYCPDCGAKMDGNGEHCDLAVDYVRKSERVEKR